MTIDLYYVNDSPPCRAVMLVAKSLNITLNLKFVDLEKEEHLKPEYLKINPAHTVPTLVDGDLTISESRAIITYLANQYGKGSSLYPTDPKARAVVDARLYFDIGTLYQSFASYFFPMIFEMAPADDKKRQKVYDALKLFDGFLEGQKFAAGNTLTVADLSIIAGVSTMESSDIDFKKYPNIKKWYETVKKTAPGWAESEKGLDEFKAYVDNVFKNKK